MVGQQLEKIKLNLKEQHTKNLASTLLNVKPPKNIHSDILNKIMTLMEIHETLCKVANTTNSNYNIQMLPAITHEFFISLYSIFYYYWMHSSKPFSASCWLAWGFLKSYEILHVTISCHLASQQANIVGRKVHKVLIRTQNDEIEEKLLMFSKQVQHSSFKFTLCGLFNIDAGLLFNMIGSSTTFIVIMIQFQETITPTICVSNKKAMF
ncbi:putative gustatory receptor 28b [Tribolium castaneum]|uniref:putative gustatory receptor 28b n=1 Tax=Tribolium castaneum TaxID=7070 RepID=UPI00077DB862|nr:PREDICTED: putative gustatory receptor 28b [Tribolium castaneum]|eukprot:XP_015837383.1 PREDICTED: putative gustatory receptor 28b [Tribolium castaneum]